ncbi:hypothetical protein H5T51_00570 [Candidatus Bathyarchaeota archaeon]|nr:hypothetical protein [Candidatus Bathyarchaeota archaeon]
MSFEIQELPDVIKVVVLLSLRKKRRMRKTLLKKRLDSIAAGRVRIDMNDLDEALDEMISEGLITNKNGTVQLTSQGLRLSREWESLLLKKDPIIEVVAGLVDGSITGLVVVLSSLIAGLTAKTALFAALLTLTAVAITNFSSFLLGGITEDLADIRTLQTLMNFSLSDIPDKEERGKSLRLVRSLFKLLRKEVNRANLYAAVICSITTFLAGAIPITAYLALPAPFNAIASFTIIGAVVGVFLVRYRSKKTQVKWKTTLIETLVIFTIASLASLLLGGIA